MTLSHKDEATVSDLTNDDMLLARLVEIEMEISETGRCVLRDNDLGDVQDLIARFEREVSTNKDETIAKLEAALEKADRAIAEYYRYWTGGETRGSYDGKPERSGLWEAQRMARALLTSTKKEG